MGSKPPLFIADPNKKALVAESFRRAIQYIEDNGWFQGDWYENFEGEVDQPYPENCRVCLMGSMAVVTGQSLGDSFSSDTYNNMEMYASFRLEDLTRYPNSFLAEWNDDSETTKEDVIDFLNAMAQELEQGYLFENG